jgi:hypothetical protein
MPSTSDAASNTPLKQTAVARPLLSEAFGNKKH